MADLTRYIGPRAWPVRWKDGAERRWPVLPSLVRYRMHGLWGLHRATRAQLDRLAAYGLEIVPGVRFDCGRLSHILDQCERLDGIFGCDPLPASARQRAWLLHHGADPEGLSRDEAGELIEKIRLECGPCICSHLISRQCVTTIRTCVNTPTTQK